MKSAWSKECEQELRAYVDGWIGALPLREYLSGLLDEVDRLRAENKQLTEARDFHFAAANRYSERLEALERVRALRSKV